MRTKLAAACVSLVAFAAVAVAPAGASASPHLTETGGSAVKVGALFEATNEGSIVFTTVYGSVACPSSTLTGNVTENSGTSIKGDITKAIISAVGGGPCQTTLPTSPAITIDTEPNLPWCLTTESADTWSVRGGACNEAGRSLTITVTGSVLLGCTYERATLTGSFETSKDLQLKIGANQLFKRAGGAVCGGTDIILDGAWNVFTDVTPSKHDITTALTIT